MKQNDTGGQKSTKSGERSFSAVKAISLYRVRKVGTFESHPMRRFIFPLQISLTLGLPIFFYPAVY